MSKEVGSGSAAPASNESDVESTADADGGTEAGSSNTVGEVKLRRADLAHARVLARLREQPEEKLMNINFDIPTLIPTLLTAGMTAREYRHLFEQTHPFDILDVDDFDDYVLALAHTHAIVRISEETIVQEDVPYLMERRKHLHGDAKRASERGYLDPKKLEKITLNNNQTELAYDAMALANLFLLSWDELKGKTGASYEELETVREKANNLLLMSPSKGETPTSLLEAQLDRRRAVTKVFRSHRKLRLGLAMWFDTQAEVDAIIPPLVLRKRRKPAKPGAPTDDAAAQDEFEDDDEVDPEGTLVDAVIGTEVASQPVPRNSVFTTKASTPMKAAVGAGLPGSSPVDDEE